MLRAFFVASLCALAACGGTKTGGTTGGTTGGDSTTDTGDTTLALVITQAPNASVAAGASLGTVLVEIHGAGGSLDTTQTSTVTVTLLAAGGNPNATLAGTKAVAAVAGVAHFTDLSVSSAGTYTLVPAPSSNTVTSTAFVVSGGAASQLSFAVQPNVTLPDNYFYPALKVQITDAFGNVATNANDIITLSIKTNPAAGTLSGVISRPAVRGVATFALASINNASASPYVLRASNGTLVADSNSFLVRAPSWKLRPAAPDSNVLTLVSGKSVAAGNNTLYWVSNPNTYHTTIDPTASSSLTWVTQGTAPILTNVAVDAVGTQTVYGTGVSTDPNFYSSANSGTAFAGTLNANIRMLTADPTTGGRVYGLVSSGVYHGVYVSNSSGGSPWTHALSVNPTLFAVAPGISGASVLYTYDSNATTALYVSKDTGVTWAVPVASPGTALAGATVTQLAVDTFSSTGGTLYAGTSKGLLKSVDFGTTWTEVPLPDSIDKCVPLVVTTPTVASLQTTATVYITYGTCTAPDQLLRSSDGGATWKDASWGLPGPYTGLFLAPDRITDKAVYATSVSLGALYVTTVGGL